MRKKGRTSGNPRAHPGIAWKGNEEGYRALIEQTGRMIYDVDVTTGRVRTSGAITRITGYAPEEFQGDAVFWKNNIHPDDRQEVARSMMSAMGRTCAFRYEYRLRRKNGTYVMVEDSALFFTDPLGNVSRILGMISDIGEARETQERLRRTEERYRELVENANSIILRMDKAGKITFFNEFAQRFFGYSHEEIDGMNAVGAIVAEGGATERDLNWMLQDIGRNPDLYANTICENIRRGGEPVWIAWTNKPVYDDGKRVVGLLCIGNDIGERKRAEDVLRESEEKYRGIIENAVDGVFQSTPGGRFLGVNPALANMCGYSSPSEMIADVRDIARDHYGDPENRDRFKKIMEEHGSVRNFEHQIRRKDGSLIWVAITAWAVRDSKGDIVRYEGTHQNITERKQAQEELRAAHRHLLDIIEFLPDATFVIDRDRRVIAWNKAIEVMTGVKKEEMLGRGNYEYSVPFYGEHRPVIIDLVLEKDDQVVKKYDFVHKEGNTLFVEVFVPNVYRGKGGYLWATASPLFDSEGNVIGAIESIRDTTEQKRIERALQESEERYRTAIESSNDGIAMVKGMVHAYVNQKFLEIFGFESVDEVVGHPVDITVHKDDKQKVIDINLRRQNKENVPDQYEFRGIKKNGETVYVEVSATRTTYQGEAISLAFLRDVTERKTLEAQLLQAHKMEAIGTLAGGVAHDFNNILMALMGYANLVQLKMRQNDPIRVYVDQMVACTGKAANLTQSLLAFSRKQLMELKPCKINALVVDVEKLLRTLLPEDIVFALSLGTDTTIMADMTQIDQVLMNLAANARDAMPKGGELRIETARIKIGDDFKRFYGYGKPGTYAVVSVSDTGMGMNEKTREKIFEPFYTTKAVGKGTGLGLSIVYGIIKQHNGFVNVYSEPNAGTTFRIYIPEAKTRTTKKERAGDKVEGGTETILFAEDNPDIRRIAKETLAMSGYTLIEAVDGQDAVEKFMEHRDKIDLLVLDVVMPNKNGKEAYDEITAVQPDIKTLFISGHTGDVILSKGIHGEFNYVPKPFSPRTLLAKIREVLDK